ncbi:unnamed protein product [Caenorhabditis bovis]|uniref:Uncharacterized protein n=1 Tax=Caenorhabditis bovis TaxID=2654633 RepID=A0A8S1FA02_9PELO|nr:unnamed protein product [Caenorhabditis bovis]
MQIEPFVCIHEDANLHTSPIESIRPRKKRMSILSQNVSKLPAAVSVNHDDQLSSVTRRFDAFIANLEGIDRLHFDVISLMQTFAYSILTVDDAYLPIRIKEIYTQLHTMCNSYKRGFHVLIDSFLPEVNAFYELEVELSTIKNATIAEVRRKELLMHLVLMNLGCVFGQVIRRRGMENDEDGDEEEEEDEEEEIMEHTDTTDDSSDDEIEADDTESSSDEIDVVN